MVPTAPPRHDGNTDILITSSPIDTCINCSEETQATELIVIRSKQRKRIELRHRWVDISKLEKSYISHFLNNITTTTTPDNILHSQRFTWQLKCYVLFSQLLFTQVCQVEYNWYYQVLVLLEPIKAVQFHYHPQFSIALWTHKPSHVQNFHAPDISAFVSLTFRLPLTLSITIVISIRKRVLNR